MSLNFYNASPNTIYLAILFYDQNCGAGNQYFSKSGWYAIASGATMTPNIAPLAGDLRNGNARAYFFAQQFAASGGATWSGTGNVWTMVPNGAGFGQCFADNSNCQQWVDFIDIEFNGQGTVLVTIGPAGGQSSVAPVLPDQLDWDSGAISFDNGVPVGGSSHLTLRKDGTYTFSGHFHDSGATEYNMTLAWGVADSQHRVYTFSHSGHVAGTFEPGSRDDTWSVDGQNDAIAQNWANIVAGNYATWEAGANLDLTNLVNSIISTIGTVLGVVGIVIAIV
jgi:hypothetical protein